MKKDSKIPENLLAPVKPTLVANMERVVELAATLKLDAEFDTVAQPYLAYIAERMSLTEQQALLLSLFLEKSNKRCIQISDFSEMIGCRNIRIISLMSEVDALVDRRLIVRKKDSDGSFFYRMPNPQRQGTDLRAVALDVPCRAVGKQRQHKTQNRILNDL